MNEQNIPSLRREAPAEALVPPRMPTALELQRAGFAWTMLRPAGRCERPDEPANSPRRLEGARAQAIIVEVRAGGSLRRDGRAVAAPVLLEHLDALEEKGTR